MTIDVCVFFVFGGGVGWGGGRARSTRKEVFWKGSPAQLKNRRANAFLSALRLFRASLLSWGERVVSCRSCVEVGRCLSCCRRWLSRFVPKFTYFAGPLKGSSFPCGGRAK